MGHYDGEMMEEHPNTNRRSDASKDSVILGRIKMLNNSITEVQDLLHDLAKALEPVMGPKFESPEKEKFLSEDAMPSSLISQEIETKTRRTDALAHDIRSILERLEV